MSVSSPHPWGCFHVGQQEVLNSEVFPTPVGVFLVFCRSLVFCVRLPHTRGGVSHSHPPQRRCTSSSPHPWGCFYSRFGGSLAATVFPTPVGVFPRPDQSNARPSPPPFPARTMTRRGAPDQPDDAAVTITKSHVFGHTLFRKSSFVHTVVDRSPRCASLSSSAMVYSPSGVREAEYSSGEQP